MLGIELRMVLVLGKHSTTELHPQLVLYLLIICTFINNKKAVLFGGLTLQK
jgi:uncharacterized membrane protein YfbV (UPF0208 family)